MITLTIPKSLAVKGDLIVMPRCEYERFLQLEEKYNEIDRDLDEAICQVKQRKTFGPFNSVKELKKSLGKR